VGKLAGIVQGLREQTAMSTPIRAALWISGCWDHLLLDDAVVAGAMLGGELGTVARGPSMTIWWAALAKRSNAELPRMGLSNKPNHSSTLRLELMPKLALR
jgi:hypothetical protein